MGKRARSPVQSIAYPNSCLGPSQISPVARCYVLAYSCAAAREFHPLPCPPRMRRTRELISKSSTNVLEQLFAVKPEFVRLADYSMFDVECFHDSPGSSRHSGLSRLQKASRPERKW
jgi:hypothetical protein